MTDFPSFEERIAALCKRLKIDFGPWDPTGGLTNIAIASAIGMALLREQREFASEPPRKRGRPKGVIRDDHHRDFKLLKVAREVARQCPALSSKAVLARTVKHAERKGILPTRSEGANLKRLRELDRQVKREFRRTAQTLLAAMEKEKK